MNNSLKSVLVLSAIPIGFCLSATGCDFFSYDKSLTWKEEVKQPDGRVIILTREQEFRDRHYDVGDQKFEFTHPRTGEYIRWYGHRHLMLVALFTIETDTYLVALPTWGSSAHFLNCPNPPYLLYRYRDTWGHIPLREIPVQEFRPNVLTHVWLHIDEIKKSKWNAPIPQKVLQIQTYNREPWLIDIGLMKEQTFGKNCGRQSDMLIRKTKKAT
jgi:hypothetical protein